MGIWTQPAQTVIKKWEKHTDVKRKIALELVDLLTRWFAQIDDFHLLQVIEMRSRPNGYTTWCVTFIQFIICVDVYLIDGGFALKLYVDQMRQLSIGLPVGVHAIVAQLLNTKTYNDNYEWANNDDIDT